MGTGPTKPSTVWYWVAGFIAVAGLVCGVVLGLTTVWSIGDRVEAFPRASVPGQVTVPVGQPGEQVVFYEAVDTDNVPAVNIRVTDPAGAPVAVERYSADLRYERNGTLSRAVATFATPGAGDYLITTSGDGSGVATFSVGPSLATGVAAVIGAVGLMFGSLTVALLLAVGTLVMRNRNKAGRPTAVSAPRTPAGVA